MSGVHLKNVWFVDQQRSFQVEGTLQVRAQRQAIWSIAQESRMPGVQSMCRDAGEKTAKALGPDRELLKHCTPSPAKELGLQLE